MFSNFVRQLQAINYMLFCLVFLDRYACFVTICRRLYITMIPKWAHFTMVRCILWSHTGTIFFKNLSEKTLIRVILHYIKYSVFPNVSHIFRRVWDQMSAYACGKSCLIHRIQNQVRRPTFHVNMIPKTWLTFENRLYKTSSA